MATVGKPTNPKSADRTQLVAMDVLYEAGVPDAGGIPLQVCVDAWVTGKWVVLIGREAVNPLNADYPVRIDS